MNTDILKKGYSCLPYTLAHPLHGMAIQAENGNWSGAMNYMLDFFETSTMYLSIVLLAMLKEDEGAGNSPEVLKAVGKIDDKSDDIIRDSVLYDYICRILETLTRKDVATKASITEVIRDQISDYKEAMAGARDRLANALEIIVTAYYAALIKRSSDEMLANLMSSY